MSSRWVVLGVAQPHSGWLRDVARWSSTAVAPVELLVAASAEEGVALLRSGRRVSCVLLDASLHDVERELLGGPAPAVVVVDRDPPRAAWRELGAAEVLSPGFAADELLRVLRATAREVDDLPAPSGAAPAPAPPSTAATLLVVCGAGGTGTSTTARLLAQGTAAAGSAVVLADLALHADQAMLHDVGDVVPGVQELVEAHRRGAPTGEQVRQLTWWADHLGYHLLLGLRRHRDWTALRPRSLDAALASLRATFATVVVDTDDDVEDAEMTGSNDVEDRNRLARASLARADLVLVTVRPDTAGLHRLAVTAPALLAAGVAAERLVPVVVRSPRHLARRAELVRTIAALADPVVLSPPLHVPHRADVERSVRSGTALAERPAAALAASVAALLHRLGQRTSVAAEPVAVVPGTLGSWMAGAAP